jgi:hypothetical protein
MKKCYIEARGRGTPYSPEKEGKLIVIVPSCVGIAFLNTSLKDR